MPHFYGSKPFSYSRDELKHLGEQFALSLIGPAGVFATTILVPSLQEHVASQFGLVLVAMFSAGTVPTVQAIRKFFGDTTGGSSGAGGIRTYALAMAVLLAPSLAESATAAPIAVTVPSTPANYLLAVDASGNATLLPLGQVLRFDGPTPPGPPGPTPPPVPPTPGPLTDRAVQIRDAALKVTGDPDRVTTAHGLAELYRQIAKLVRTPGQVTDANSLAAALKFGTDTFLASRGAAQPWQPVRDVFSVQWTVLAARNAPLADYATLLDEAAAGLDASAPAKGIDPEVLKLILQIVQKLLPLILKNPALVS